MLTNLANLAANVDDEKKAKILRQMKKAEQKARVYNLLKFQRNNLLQAGGIDRLEVPASWPNMEDYDESIDYNLTDPKSLDPTDSSQWKNVICPKEIEFYLRLRNCRHFGQAEGTPSTSPSMKQKFNWSATTNEAELVLNCEYTDKALSHVQRMLLDNMKRVTSNESSPTYLTSTKFDNQMKKWRESTSTSPSGRHLGHYKVLLSTPDRTLKDDEIKDIKSIQSDIKKCYLGLINYCIRH